MIRVTQTDFIGLIVVVVCFFVCLFVFNSYKLVLLNK